MTLKEKAESKLNCFYAAKNLIEGRKEKSSTEIVLSEARKIWEWVSKKEEDE